MKNILIIGASGSLGKRLIDQLLNKNIHLTLLSRHAESIDINNSNVDKINANIMSTDIEKYFKNQDAVFVALSGDLPAMVSKIITSMDKQNVSKLVFIASMGIYNEIPKSIGTEGNLINNPFLQNYREAADLIEDSDLNYTIMRPGWFDNGNDNFEITNKDEPFGGHNVSRTAIVKYAENLLLNTTLNSKQSIGINRPEWL